MPILNDPALNAALNAIWDALPDARIVGGAVRDTLADHPVTDIDLATPSLPEAVMAALDARGLRTIPTGLAHGTVTALSGMRAFEITTLRRDIETNGRHAQIAFTDDWQIDAARRDFTINAMSMDRGGAVFDYFGGRADLAAGIVRFVGPAELRITEDYLRILRFFRFYARYENGAADAEAIAAITALRNGITGLSAERIWQELKRILVAPDPQAAVHLMDETGVLALVIPKAESLAGFDALFARAAPADPLLRVAALIGGGGETLADRLKLSDAERLSLARLREAPILQTDADRAAQRRALADWDAETLIARSWLAADNNDRGPLRESLSSTSRPVFPLGGRDAVALGASPGPIIGHALAATRAWWLARDCDPDTDACRAELRKYL